jgi:quercetin dioxygenase-like cupin family protein
MNLKDLHTKLKPVSAIPHFKAAEGNVTAIQILNNQLLKEHTTKTPALLVCVTGEVVFENEKGIKEILLPGDYVNIEPMVKHSVKGIEDSQLLLIK